MFTSTAKARWQEMVVLLSKHNTEQEAFNKISWMGNQVASGAPFEKIAEANSDGFTASKGGVWDWTTREDLASPELVQAIFTQPRGQLSPAIIRSDNGLHIIRVLERQEVKVVPFVEAQGTIRDEIKKQRGQRYQNEYFADLRRRFPTQIIKQRIDFNANNLRTANRP
jgi:parvulin-like peptidyl-prolyl isomerase